MTNAQCNQICHAILACGFMVSLAIANGQTHPDRGIAISVFALLIYHFILLQPVAKSTEEPSGNA